MDQLFFAGTDDARPVGARERHRLTVAAAMVLVVAVGTALVAAQASSRPVALDVKSRSTEKADLAAAKAGTLTCLRRAGWARITEFGEDYSVWLTQYRREADRGGVQVSLIVELRTPGMLRSGTLLASRAVVVWLPATLAAAPAGSLASVIRHEFERESDEFHREAVVVGARVADVVREFVVEVGGQSSW